MTRFIKWLAFYLLFIPASIIGYTGDMIIPDRKDVIRMSLTKALMIILVVGTFAGAGMWVLYLFLVQYV